MKYSVKRVLFMALLDCVIVVACAFIAMLTRFAPTVSGEIVQETAEGLLRILPSYVAVNLLFGMYRVKWRDMNFALLMRQALGCVTGFGVSFVWEELLDLDLSRRYYLLIVFAFVECAVCGSRVVMKLIRDVQAKKQGDEPEKSCVLTVSEGKRPGSIALSVQNEPVPGGEEDIDSIVSERGVTEIIICTASSDSEFNDRIASLCLSTGCSVKRI